MLQLLGVSAAITPAWASPLDSTGSFAAGHTVPRLPWAWCTTFDATTRLCIGLGLLLHIGPIVVQKLDYYSSSSSSNFLVVCC